jgi:hypothetical protein
MCPSGRIAGVSCPRPNGSGITALCDRGSRTSEKRRRLRRLPGYGAIRAWRIERRNDNAVKERPRHSSSLRLCHKPLGIGYWVLRASDLEAGPLGLINMLPFIAFVILNSKDELLGSWICLADNIHQLGKVPRSVMTFRRDGTVLSRSKGTGPLFTVTARKPTSGG